MEIVGIVRFEPELRFTPTAKAVCNFQVQTEDIQKELIRVVAWNDLAENCAENLKKGDRVRVFGDKKTRKYQARDGETKTLEELVAYRVQVFAKKEE